MRPKRIAGAGAQPLGAPVDWDEEQNGHCVSLFIRRDTVGDVEFMRSAWEVEAGEAARLYAGAPLELGVSGQCHPVVNLGVGVLPADFDPVLHARTITNASGQQCVRVEMLFPHNAGSTAFAVMEIDKSFSAAVAQAIEAIEALARHKGWIE